MKYLSCKWDPNKKAWTTPVLTRDEISYKQLKSMVDACDGHMVPVKLSGECKRIQDILNDR